MLPIIVLLLLFSFDQILACDSWYTFWGPHRERRPSVDLFPGVEDLNEGGDGRFQEGGLAAALEAAVEEGAAYLHAGVGRRPSVLDFGGADDMPLPGVHRGGNRRPRLFAAGNEAEGDFVAAAETDSGGESDASAEDFQRPHRGADGANEAAIKARLEEAFPPLLLPEELAALEASTLSAAGGFHPDDDISAWAPHALSVEDAEAHPEWFAELVREGVVAREGGGGQLPVSRAKRVFDPREARRSALVLSAMLREPRPGFTPPAAAVPEGGALTGPLGPPGLHRQLGVDIHGDDLDPARRFVPPPPLPVAEVRTVDGGIAEVIARGDADEGARAVAAHVRRPAPPEQPAWVLHQSPIRASRRPEGVRPHIPHLALPAPAVDAVALAAPREQDGWEHDAAATVGAAGATPRPVLEAGAERGADDEAAHSARGLAWSIDALRRILRGGRDALYDASVSEFLGCYSSPPERLSCLHEILQMEVRMRERSVCSAQRAYEAERRRLLEAQRNTLSRLRLHIRLMQMEQREDVVIGNGYRPDYEHACARYFDEAADLVERLRRRMRVLKIEVEMGELREVRARALYVKFRGEALAAVRNRARQTVLDLQLAEMERREDPRLAPLTHSASAVRLPRAPLLVSPMRVPAGGDTRVGFQ